MKAIKNIFFIVTVYVTVTLIVACNQNVEPPITTLDNQRETIANSSKRSPAEAIKVAQEAYGAFFGENPSSRIDDEDSSLFIISSNSKYNSRSATDTCLYVVNFGNEKGFAIVAADRAASSVMGISDNGHYNPDTPEENPGVEYYIGRTIEYLNSYVASNPAPQDAIIISGPDDPKMQVKEWEDTTFEINIPRRVNNSWLPGLKYSTSPGSTLEVSDLPNNPTGYYYSKYWCGEAVIAIAHTLLYFSYPTTIMATWHPLEPSTKTTPAFNPDWDKMKRHRRYTSSGSVEDCTELNPCSPNDNDECHTQIALLCRAIGNLTSSTYYGTQKLAIMVCDLTNVYDTYQALGFHVQPWREFGDDTSLYNPLPTISRSILLLNGLKATDIGEMSHYWIIDGQKKFTARHHYSTKEGAKPWVDIITATYSRDMFHINWSVGGNGDGWYEKGPFYSDFSNEQYLNVQYTEISLP